MTDTKGTIRAFVACQVQACAEEVSYPLDMVKIWKGEPICENCFNHDAATDDDGANLFDWNALPGITLKDLCE